jgi:C4-dicarboxylate transporter, DctQ subunit
MSSTNPSGGHSAQGAVARVTPKDAQHNRHALLAIPRGMASILNWVTRVSAVVSGLALAGILLLTLNEVARRYFFNAPTTWAGEANQWLFALAVMLAIPEITRTNGHISISILMDRLPQAKRAIASTIIMVLSALMCVAAFYISGMETMRQFANGITTVWVHPIPKWWISWAIPFGFLLSALQFLRLSIVLNTEKTS